jgi:ribosomal protein S18 acetylase RimI-like enzyme
MQPTLRPYNDCEDYWRVRQFLRAISPLNERHDHSWSVVRFDYWRWHVHKNIEHFALNETVFLWETEDRQIVAVLNPDNRGDAFLQVHPAYRTPHLEEEMLCVAEERLAVVDGNVWRKLTVWANEDDTLRQTLLKRRGYLKGEWPEYQRRRSMSLPVAEVKIAPGYTLRALGDVEELPSRSYVSWQAFHPGEPDEKYEGWTWYHNVQRAPLYRRDLDLVAVAADGEFAAFCTVWFDDVNRVGVFEPVGTAPAHQRHGLGKALMSEGLRRLKHLGATLATVGSYSAEAGALYASVGFTEYDLLERWEIMM